VAPFLTGQPHFTGEIMQMLHQADKQLPEALIGSHVETPLHGLGDRVLGQIDRHPMLLHIQFGFRMIVRSLSATARWPNQPFICHGSNVWLPCEGGPQLNSHVAKTGCHPG
jgi:hypothetical protein